MTTATSATPAAPQAADKGYRRPELLVDTDWLAEHIDDPDLRLFDCSAYPAPNTDPGTRGNFPIAPQNGRARYDEGHIPGAAFLDVPGELADKTSALPMTLPTAGRFAETVGRHGIGDGHRVVLYSTATPIWPARVWWMLRAHGFDNAAVLNGGLSKWTAERRPVSTTAHSYGPARFTARPRPEIIANKAEVLAALNDNGVRLIHALSPDVYSGASDTLVFGRRGHIPGSVNVPSGRLTDETTTEYLPAARLHDIFEAVGANSAGRIVTYCGGGVNASSAALALLGHENVAVYDGSMNEWGNDPALPIRLG